MKVKKYSAASMGEAMKQIRKELGSDAVILSSKPVFTGGFIGLFKKRSIEVVAAVEDNRADVPVAKEKEKRIPTPASEGKTAEREITSDKRLLKELEELKSLIKGTGGVSADRYPLQLQPIKNLLEDQEVGTALQEELMETLFARWQESKGLAAEGAPEEWLKDALIQKLDEVTEWGAKFKKKYINFVGPTGVGKTTTLAKAAADLILLQNQKVAFITTDTYRIAAIDQLKTYAKILNVPIEVAYNLDDFRRAAERFAHYDTVFIDTAGRNFRNQEYVKDLADIIDFSTEMETYLVLSLTSKEKDMKDIYQQFSLIEIKQAIFTKADETSSYGNMINFIIQQGIGAAYITNGQDVPDDIQTASPELLAQTIAGEKSYV